MYRLNSLLDNWPEAPAIIFGGREISARQIQEDAATVAGGLREAGVTKGDRVAVWLPNCPAWLEVLFACAQLGAIAVAVNTCFKSVEVQDIIGRSGAKVLVMWPGFKGIDFLSILREVDVRALSALRTVVVLGDTQVQWAGDQELVTYGALKCQPPVSDYSAQDEDGCAIFTTSGTTRAPKFVLHNHRSTVHHAYDVVRAFAYDDADACFLLAVPICGVFGYAQMMATLAARRPTVLMPYFDGTAAGALIRENHVTHLNATDDMLEAMLIHEIEDVPFPSVNGGAKRDHLGGVRRDRLAAAGLSP